MKPLLFSLSIFLSVSVRAQPDKRDITIRQQLAGLWQLDISRDSSAWENDMGNVPFVQFLEGDRLVVITGGSLLVSTYDIAFSSRDTFLMAEDFQAKIKSTRINGKWTVNEIRFKESEGHTDKLIRIGVSIPLPINLSNAYDYSSERGWTIYPPLSALPQGDLELNEDLSFKWDSIGTGTWKLDSLQARINFQTSSKLFVYEILKVDYNLLVLRPEGSKDPDSVIAFGTYRHYSFDEEKSRIQDSVMVADSVAAALQAFEIMAMEYETSPTNFRETLKGTWNAYSPLSSIDVKAFTLIFNEDGTMILQKGKKEKKYNWELLALNGNVAHLKLIKSGNEELGIVELYDFANHQFTFIDPFTGKLESFHLQRAE